MILEVWQATILDILSLANNIIADWFQQAYLVHPPNRSLPHLNVSYV